MFQKVWGAEYGARDGFWGLEARGAEYGANLGARGPRDGKCLESRGPNYGGTLKSWKPSNGKSLRGGPRSGARLEGRGPKPRGGSWPPRGDAFLRGTSMAWDNCWPMRPLLKLFLSPSATVLETSTFLATAVHAPEHRGHRPLFGGPGAVKLPLRRENLLPLALPHVLGSKYGLFQRVISLSGHQARRLRDIVLLPDPGLVVFYATARRDCSGQLLACIPRIATIGSLCKLGQGGEGIKCIAAHVGPEGEALCLWERPGFHARSHDQMWVCCSRKNCGIFLGGKKIFLGILRRGRTRGPVPLELTLPGHHIVEESLGAHGCQPLLGVGDVLLGASLGHLGDSGLAFAAFA